MNQFINQTIAQLENWKRTGVFWHSPDPKMEGFSCTCCPDYTGDLNEISILVSRLGRADYVKWTNILKKICKGDSYYNATAEEKAKAWLMLKGGMVSSNNKDS